MNYIDDLKIDPDQLDIEWLEQPLLFHKYSSASAQANQFVRKCEELMKVVRSQLTLEASQKGEQVLGQRIKPTAVNVEAYYRTHKDYIQAKTSLSEAQYEAEMLTNAVYAFHQRKSALENLIKLHGQNYFAGPVVPRELSAKYKENQKERLREQRREKTAKVMKKNQNTVKEEESITSAIISRRRRRN